MSAKTRVQLSDTGRKLICELAQSSTDLTHEKVLMHWFGNRMMRSKRF